MKNYSKAWQTLLMVNDPELFYHKSSSGVGSSKAFFIQRDFFKQVMFLLLSSFPRFLFSSHFYLTWKISVKIYEVKNVGGGSLRSFYRLQISEQEFEVKTFTQLMH